MAHPFLCRKWEEALPSPDTRPIYDWAANIELPGAYAEPGGFDVSKVPFCRAVFQALFDPTVREVTSMSGVQCIKTLIGEIFLLWQIVNNPGPMQWLQPTDDDAQKHCEERFNSLMAACPAVAALFTGNRHEKKIASVIFKTGFLRMEGAASLGNLQRKSIRTQMCSEVWLWQKDRLSEAAGRLTQFPYNSKRYIESQAGIADDDLHLSFKAGDQNVWSFRCIACGHVQPWEWTVFRPDQSRAGMRWEDSPKTRRENGEWRLSELAPTIRYECVKCGHGHQDDARTRHVLNSNGLYVPGNPEAAANKRSFSWNQLTIEKLTWFSQVEKFLIANEQAKKGDDSKLREFFQKSIAQPYDPARFFKFNTPAVVEITSDWPAEVMRPMTVDVQEDCFWAVIRAWALDGESHLLWAGRLTTWQDVADKQAEWKVPDGQVFVDCSDQTRLVYQQCVAHGHLEIQGNHEVWVSWKGLNGDPRKSFPYVYRDRGSMVKIDLPFSWPESFGDPLSGKSGQGLGRMCPFVHWSNPTIKDITARLRDGKGAPYKVYEGVPPEWTAHMYSERKIRVWDRFGGESLRWERIGKRENHLWDCENMSTSVACMRGCIGGGIPVATPLPAS